MRRALWLLAFIGCLSLIFAGAPRRGDAAGCGTSITLTGAGCAPVASGGPYVGPADVAGAAQVWVGFRGYSTAYSTGANPAADVCDVSTGLTCTTINILSNGKFDAATAAGSSSCLVSCNVSKLYDQTGGGIHLTQSTNANRPLVVFGAISGLACMSFSSNQNLVNATGLSVQAQPFTVSAVNKKSTSAQAATPNIFGASVTPAGAFYNGSATPQSVGTYAGSAPVINATASDGAFHTEQFLFNGASSNIIVDTTTTSGNLGGNAFTGNITIGQPSSTFDTFIECEAGVWNGTFSGTVQTNLNSQQHAFWGF